ncbi:hypothetical protein GOP47_0004232 [Adiantum capillus-veneris]|uniref:GrpE protein homolog n=1 Tax=Adiantum capillus-veneris TaxID=13818 RepID=A0A9D4V7P7_ADICA|nr:hypothetical protein GOP47_0004232 [Adiantum capillus-veneris]
MGTAAAIRSARSSLSHLRRSCHPGRSFSTAVSLQRLSSSGGRTSLSQSSPFSEWLRLLSSGGRTSLSNLQYERAPMAQVVTFSSAASPISEKDGNPDSSVEENSVSGDEKVEPVIETKEEPTSPEANKEEAAESKEESKKVDKEALLNAIGELEVLISEKQSQLVELKERAETTKAELENVRTRSQREADNTKKYAIQDFAKALLDIGDNLGRALMTIPANVRNELLTDQSEAGKQLKSLVEGLITTEKELMKVLKKFGVEKFEPVGQQFDPNSHLALFEVPDPSKEAGTVSMVAKVGYMLHDRVLRPAEVGVVKSPE